MMPGSNWGAYRPTRSVETGATFGNSPRLATSGGASWARCQARSSGSTSNVAGGSR